MALGDILLLTSAAFIGLMIVMPVLLIVKGPTFSRHAFGWVAAGAGVNAGLALFGPEYERGFYLVYIGLGLFIGLVVLSVAGAIASARARRS